MLSSNILKLRKGLTPKEFLNNLIHWFKGDARHFQIVFLSIFLFYGIQFLNWEMNAVIIASTFITCLLTQLIFTSLTNKDYKSLKSALISALSLMLMLKTNFVWVIILASVLSIASKFVFTFHFNERKKHFFNPTNFGIIVTILLTQNAWISPGQWGSNGLLFFGIGILGLIILVRVKRLDVAFSFFITFCSLSFIRSVLVIGWEFDFFLHQLTSGALLLFTFFMITDPVSTPSNSYARIIWGMLVAALAFYLSAYEFVNGAPLWALFFISPTTILFDRLCNKFNPKEFASAHSIAPKSLLNISSL